MSTKLSDDYLESQISSLQKHIEEWTKKHDLWYDCGFTSWIERYDDEPYENPCVLIFCFEGPLYNVFNLGVDELVEEFDALIESNTKFFCGLEDHVTMSFWVKEDEISLNAAFNRPLKNPPNRVKFDGIHSPHKSCAELNTRNNSFLAMSIWKNGSLSIMHCAL